MIDVDEGFDGASLNVFGFDLDGDVVSTSTVEGAPGVEVADHLGGNGEPGFSVDFDGKSLTIVQNATGTGPRPYSNESFSGFTITDVTDTLPRIRELVEVANFGGPFDISQVTIEPDLFRINLGGRLYSEGAELSFRFNFSASQDEAETLLIVYEAALDRDGSIDLPGFNYWIDIREDFDLSFRQITGFFLEDGEFTRKFGPVMDISNGDFIDLMYDNVLDRAGDTQGLEFWNDVITRAPQTVDSRAQILIDFALSNENALDLGFADGLQETTPGNWDFV